jgi:hypothetical protein
MKTFWKVVGATAGIILVVLLVGWALDWITLPTRVIDPNKGLANWQWFYDTNQALSALNTNVQVADKAISDYLTVNGNLDTWNWQQQDEYQRLLTVKNGYIVRYNTLAAEYNAKMDDMTRNWSAPPDLPRHIPNIIQ